MKFISYLFLFMMMFTSCIILIKNKKNILDINSIGLNEDEIKLNGYYYREKSYKAFPYYSNEYGGYSQDFSKEYNQIRVLPIVLYSDGTAGTQHSRSGIQDYFDCNCKTKCSLEDFNTTESAFKHFACHFKNEPEDNYNFINKKSRIWDQGVYKTNGSEIIIQTFYNVMGNYYLREERGRIINDTTFVLTSAKDYQDGKTIDIEEEYHFKEMINMPKIESYIMDHKNKFDKN